MNNCWYNLRSGTLTLESFSWYSKLWYHDATYEFNPVTVPALTPKKNESMADRFP